MSNLLRTMQGAFYPGLEAENFSPYIALLCLNRDYAHIVGMLFRTEHVLLKNTKF